MKKIIVFLLLVLFSVPCFAITDEQYEAYFAGVGIIRNEKVRETVENDAYNQYFADQNRKYEEWKRQRDEQRQREEQQRQIVEEYYRAAQQLPSSQAQGEYEERIYRQQILNELRNISGSLGYSPSPIYIYKRRPDYTQPAADFIDGFIRGYYGR